MHGSPRLGPVLLLHDCEVPTAVPIDGVSREGSGAPGLQVEFHFLHSLVQHPAHSLMGLTQRRHIQALLRGVSAGLPKKGTRTSDLGGDTFHGWRQRYTACRETWRRERPRRVPEV